MDPDSPDSEISDKIRDFTPALVRLTIVNTKVLVTALSGDEDSVSISLFSAIYVCKNVE